MGIFGKLKDFADKVDGFINDNEEEEIKVVNMGTSSTKPAAQLYNMGVLSDPPAPPIPVENSRMSVSVAVNGKSYGPYERATLLDMIAKGSLTPQTLVFMKGMSGWLPAEQVPKVKELFSDSVSVPDVPPVPWANSNEPVSTPSSSAVVEENVLSPRLNRLISAAVADGEISDMERQVLIRNAQEEGVAMDEFVMILEARLYEQREVLLARQKEMEHKHQMEKASVMAEAAKAAAAVAPPKENKLSKCPNCGAPIKALATSCPDCGYEYNSHTNEENSAWERLNRMLNDVDNERAKGLIGGYLSLLGQGNSTPEKIEKKKRIITNFPIPSDKRSILDFFVSCATIAKEGNFFTKDPIAGAYKTKAKQVLVKARIIMKDDPKLLGELNELAKTYKIKA